MVLTGLSPSPSWLNIDKLDKTEVRIQTNLPVYISMSTIPARLNNTIELINHTLKYVKGLTKLILNLPYSYRRFPEFKINERRIREKIKDTKFYLNRCQDYGPLTKFLPSLAILPNNSILIVCDDMCYSMTAYKDIAERQDSQINKSFTYFYYPYSQPSIERIVNVPQGADMISFYTNNLREFPEFFTSFLKKMKIEEYYKNSCFFVDDLIIGFYLQYIGIPIQQVDPTHRMIYIKNCENAPKKYNLNAQKGQRSRENTMKMCYKDLYYVFPSN